MKHNFTVEIDEVDERLIELFKREFDERLEKMKNASLNAAKVKYARIRQFERYAEKLKGIT